MLSLCMRTHIDLSYMVDEMRQLLLDYGATNTRELQQAWRTKKAAIENEPERLEKFHYDPR